MYKWLINLLDKGIKRIDQKSHDNLSMDEVIFLDGWKSALSYIKKEAIKEEEISINESYNRPF